MSDRTVSAQEFSRVTRPAPAGYVDLGTLTIGATLEVETHTGSKYWITRVAGTHRSTTTVYGVSISSNTRSWGRTTKAPRDCTIDRYLYRGCTFHMSGTGVLETSTVTSWREL